MKKSIKSNHKDYFVLLCDDNCFTAKGKSYSPKGKMWRPPLICGIFASLTEAKDCMKEIKDCLCKHYIKRCSVKVTYDI